MKKLYYLALVAIVGLAMSSCSMLSPKQEFQLSDLQGLWQENNTEHYVRFTTERSDEANYLYGREWDEAEEVTEQDLIDARQESGHPGNGWFKYLFETTGNLTEIHLMDNGGAEIPKVYVVTVLTDTQLSYYEKDNKTKKSSFSKVVEKK